MDHYSIDLFLKEIKELASTNKFLAKDLALHSKLAAKEEILKIENQLNVELPLVLKELITKIDISGAQLGQITLGMRPFNFLDALVEKNLKIPKPEIFSKRNILSIGIELNWSSPVCIPRKVTEKKYDPPIVILDYYTNELIGPIYSDILTCLKGQIFLMRSKDQDPVTIRSGIEKIIGPVINESGKKYWDDYFEKL